MKRILLPFIILLSLSTFAFAQGEEDTLSSFGFAVGCFTPREKDFKHVYDDKRDTTFTLFYDKGVSKSFAIGTSLMYYSDSGFAVSEEREESRIKADFMMARAEISAVYRMITSEGQLFVPQLKLGINSTYFKEKVEDAKSVENKYFGYHAGFALLFLLDAIDQKGAKKLNAGYGVDDTYFFIGVDYADTNAFKKEKIDLGGLEYNLGIMFRY